jgi:hypothetical protein
LGDRAIIQERNGKGSGGREGKIRIVSWFQPFLWLGLIHCEMVKYLNFFLNSKDPGTIWSFLGKTSLRERWVGEEKEKQRQMLLNVKILPTSSLQGKVEEEG